MPKEIVLNAFDMNCVGHIQQGMWTHPRDQSSALHGPAVLDRTTRRTLEAGLFDGIFFADVVGVYDVYGGNPDAALRGAVQVPVNDPTLLIPAMAAVTRHLASASPSNLTYEQPYLFARRMSTLDHLTGGRIGWNIVTGYLDSAARAIGLDRPDGARRPLRPRRRIHGARLQAVGRQLGRRRGAARQGERRLCRPAKVHVIQHHGKQYRVDAMHLCEPSPQRTPVLYQAGSSTRGTRVRRDARRVRLRQRPEQGGRQGDRRRHPRARGRRAAAARTTSRCFSGTPSSSAAPMREAQEKYEEYRRYVSSEAALAHAAARSVSTSRATTSTSRSIPARARPSCRTSKR